MAKKRPRERTNVDTELVEIFEDLSNPSEAIRLKAAQLLLSKVTAENTRKILQRLLRGLCSGRKAARPGFSIALTEFLAQHAGDTTSESALKTHEVVQSLKEQTQIGGKVGGQEGKDHHLGRIFGAGAIIKSKVLFSQSESEAWDELLDVIFELSNKKSSLRKECGWVLYEAIHILEDVVNGKAYMQVVVEKLQKNGQVRTPEGVAIWIGTQRSFPGLTMPKNVFYQENPLHRKERSSLSRVLKESSVETASTDEPSQTKQRGMWYPKPHFAWGALFNASLDQQTGSDLFSELWSELVDDGLFAQSSSDERKYWGFCLFQKQVLAAPRASLQYIFGKNLLRCLGNQLASKERILHGVAEESLKAVQRRGISEPSTIPTILRATLGTIHYTSFIKPAEKLLNLAEPNQFEEIVSLFGELTNDPLADEDKTISAARQVLADLLVMVVRSGAPADNVGGTAQSLAPFREMVSQILQMFGRYAYTDIVVPPSKPVTEATRSMFRSRITSCLTSLITKDPDPSFYPYNLLNTLSSREAEQRLLFAKSADNEVREIVYRGWKTLKKMIHEETGSHDQAFIALFAITILQIYNGEADAVSILDELQECRNTLVEANDQDQAQAADAVVEIILSLTSRPSLLFRRIAKQVFSAFSSMITENGLESMIRVLGTREDVSGQDDLFDRDDVDVDAEMIDASEDSSEAQEIDDDEMASSSGDTSSSDGSDHDTATTRRDEVLEAKLSELLGTRKIDGDVTIAEEDESTDEDMDDEQMEALTPYIENTFKERGKVADKKKERKEAKEAIVQLKCRVLELLEIYIKQLPKDSKVLGIIKPVLMLIRSTTNKQVSERASNIIREASKGYKLRLETNSHDLAMGKLARTLFPEIHELILLEGSNAFANSCSQASLLLSKVMLGNGGCTIRDILDQYSSTCEKALRDPKCKYRISFHLDFHNWALSAREVLGKLRE